MGPYTHQIDPVIASVAGFHLWWYGLSYSLGFLNAHVFLRRNRARLGFSEREVYGLTLFLVVGVLIGGRSLVVFNNEWSFYRDHLLLIPAIWLGGLMALGGAIALVVSGRRGIALERGDSPLQKTEGDSPLQEIGGDCPLVAYRVAFAACLAIALVIPSDATRDIPSRYGQRHPSLDYSILYPQLTLPDSAGRQRARRFDRLPAG